MRIGALLRLTRPVFLAGGVLLYGLGTVVARSQGASLGWGRWLLGQAVVTSIQLTAQYANEYFDADVDRVDARTWLSGGSGVLPAGLLPRRVALRAAQVTSAVAAALLVPLVRLEPAAAIVAVAALAIAWAYSAPPARLVGTGLGEAVASLLVAGLVPVTGAWVNDGSLDAALGWMVAALVGAHFSMIVGFAIPDIETDLAGGKRTLAVRLGERAWLAVAGGAGFASAMVVSGVLLGGLPAATAAASLVAAPAVVVQLATARPGTGSATVLTTASVSGLALLAAGFLVATLAS